MVASFDLTRYEPPLDYLLTRIDRLVRLLDGRVDPGFVRRECAELLQEVCAFCVARFHFRSLDAKVRARTAVDTDALEQVLDLIAQAPRVPPSAQKDPAERLDMVRRGIAAIRENQHRWPVIETMLRIEIAFESAFLGGQVAVSGDWDPTPLVDLVRAKLTLIPEERRKDLWLQVIRSFAVPDDEDPDAHLTGYGLFDHGVLPQGFLDPDALDVLDRLAWFNGWHRSRVIRAMLDAGQTSYPIPTVGVAKIYAR